MDAGKRTEFFFNLPQKRYPFRAGIAGTRRVYLKQQQPLRIEADGRRSKICQRTDEQAGANQEEKRKPYLKHDERFAEECSARNSRTYAWFPSERYRYWQIEAKRGAMPKTSPVASVMNAAKAKHFPIELIFECAGVPRVLEQGG